MTADTKQEAREYVFWRVPVCPAKQAAELAVLIAQGHRVIACVERPV